MFRVIDVHVFLFWQVLEELITRVGTIAPSAEMFDYDKVISLSSIYLEIARLNFYSMKVLVMPISGT